MEGKEMLNIKVALCDDDGLVREVTQAILESFGCTVVAVGSGKELIELLKNSKPGEFGLAITDKEMPGISGIETAAEIRKIFPTLPLILYSGRLTNKDEEYIEGETLQGICLSKPFRPFELKEAIKKALAKFPENNQEK